MESRSWNKKKILLKLLFFVKYNYNFQIIFHKK